MVFTDISSSLATDDHHGANDEKGPAQRPPVVVGWRRNSRLVEDRNSKRAQMS